MKKLPHPKTFFWHGLYGAGRIVTYVLFVALDRPPRKGRDGR